MKIVKTPETFTELFDLIEARIQAKAVAAGLAAPAFKRSEAEAHEYKATNTVSVYPVTGQARRATDRGGRRHTGNGTEMVDVTDPTPLWDRHVLFAGHVYEKDVDPCNTLAGFLVAALEELLGGTNHEVTGEEWDTSTKIARGMVLVVTFRVNARWYTTPAPTTDIATTQVNPELQAPA